MAAHNTFQISLFLSKNWHSMPGAGYGICATKWVGQIQVNKINSFDSAVFQDGMNEIFGKFKAESISASVESIDESIAHQIANWYLALHQGLRVPVLPKFFIERKNPTNSSDKENFFLALPTINSHLTHKILSFIVSTANLLINNPKNQYAVAKEATLKVEEIRKAIVNNSSKGINTPHLLRAAESLKIDVCRMVDDVFRFGQGANSILLKSTLSDDASHLGVRIACDKWNTGQYLRRLGFPVPEQRIVSTPEDAGKAATEIGFPVAVKPVNQEQGRGVNAGILNSIELGKAFDAARKYSKSVLIEKHIYGDEFRFTVFKDRVIKIIRRRAAGVVGDGQSTIADLVQRATCSDEVRTRSIDPTYRPVCVDDEALSLLADQNLGPQSVIPAGKFVPMRRRANILSGGTQISVDMSSVHPDNLELAVRVTQCLRIDISGIDLIFPNVECSWFEAGGTIIEVNSMPQIGVEFTPKIYEDLLSTMLPAKGRIVVRLILQMNPAAELREANIRQMAHSLGCEAVGCRDGIWIGGKQVGHKFKSGYDASVALLSDTTVKSAAIVMTPDELLQNGLPAANLDSVSQILADRAHKNYISMLPACQRLFHHHLWKNNELI